MDNNNSKRTQHKENEVSNFDCTEEPSIICK